MLGQVSNVMTVAELQKLSHEKPADLDDLPDYIPRYKSLLDTTAEVSDVCLNHFNNQSKKENDTSI